MIHDIKLHNVKVTLIDGTVYEYQSTFNQFYFHEATKHKEHSAAMALSYQYDTTITREQIASVEIDEGRSLLELQEEMELKGIELSKPEEYIYTGIRIGDTRMRTRGNTPVRRVKRFIYRTWDMVLDMI